MSSGLSEAALIMRLYTYGLALLRSDDPPSLSYSQYLNTKRPKALLPKQSVPYMP
jgi:hypothetical protein